MEDLKHIHPCRKSLFRARNFKGATRRKVEKLYRELENSDKQLRNFVVSGGLYNTISRNSSIEKHCKLSQFKSSRKDSSTEDNSRDVEQGSNCRDPKPFGR